MFLNTFNHSDAKKLTNLKKFSIYEIPEINNGNDSNKPYNLMRNTEKKINKLSLTQNQFIFLKNKTTTTSIDNKIKKPHINKNKTLSNFSNKTNYSETASKTLNFNNNTNTRLSLRANRKESFLDISKDDEIFDDLRNKMQLYPDNYQPNIVIKNPPKKLDKMGKKLFKIYNYDMDFLNHLKRAKSQKKQLDLEKYQVNLVQTLGGKISKESIRKLNTKLRDLRLFANKIKGEKVSNYLEEIEKWEEEIIGNLREKEEQLEYIRETGKINSSSPLPRIKYKKIINTKI